MNLPRWNTTPEPQNSKSPEWRVPLASLSFSDEEIRSVTQALQSGWWTCGPETNALEREFESYFAVRHAIAVSSGTAALHLAFSALEVSEGCEVVTPALNFVAASNTLLHVKAIPHFADVESISVPLVSAETLERSLTKKTRGLCVMHYGGYPCGMDSILDLARKHKLWVVEDAAHAPGAMWQGTVCGKWGDIACFSFFGNKNLSCAEGGLVVTDRDDLAAQLRLLRSHGMTSLTWDRFRGHSHSYDVTAPGYNFRMDDLRAALLRVQLRSLDAFNRLRRERVQWYRQMLGKDTRWTIPFENYSGMSAFHLFTVVLAEGISRNQVMNFLKSRGIQTSIHYPPVHEFSFYRNLSVPRSDLKVTEALGRRILSLPLFPEMTREQVALVCDSFHEAVDSENKNAEARKLA
jgi:dTDP-4-amino-4,6-dideoxygalactose transaminase